MKIVFALLVLSFGFSSAAFAGDMDDRFFGSSGTPTFDSPVGECDNLSETSDEYSDCRKMRTCVARDEDRNRFLFTASYGYPNKTIANGALAKCEANTSKPGTCYVTVCRFGTK